jgi:hypothetical protein
MTTTLEPAQTVQGASAPKTLHPLTLVALGTTTLGLYWFFWIHRRYRELLSARPRVTASSPLRAAGLLFVPLFNVYWLFRVLGDFRRSISELQTDPGRTPRPTRRWTVVVGLGTVLLAVVSALLFLAWDTSQGWVFYVLVVAVLQTLLWSLYTPYQAALNAVWTGRAQSLSYAALAMLLVLVCLLVPGLELVRATGVLRSAFGGDVLQATLRVRPLEGDGAIGQGELPRVREVLVDSFDRLGVPAYVDVPEAEGNDLVLQVLMRRGSNDTFRSFIGSASHTFSLQEVLAGPSASPRLTQESSDGSEVIASADRQYYLLSRQHIAQGADIEDVENTIDGVVVHFNEVAANRISEYTAGHIGTRLAIVFDRAVLSAPTIDGPFGANALISNVGDLSARSELTLALRAARLGVRLDAEAVATGNRQRWVIEYGARAAVAALLGALLIAAAHRIGRPSRL